MTLRKFQDLVSWASSAVYTAIHKYMMRQNLTGDNPSTYFSLYSTNFKAETSLLSALSHLYYLDRHEPLNFAIQYAETRKTLGYGIGEFKAIYAAYKLQRGAK